MHLSEDDIRTKIVYEWLKDCPITPNEIKIEFTIKIRLGRGIKLINSRADILVTNSKGDNLIIIEVKKPSHNLHQDDRFQALSYARALAEGGIAPFTILTNGIDTLIFDSISGEEISGSVVQSTHKYIKNQFRVTGDVIGAYSEALNYLVSVSEDNLLEFCKGQSEFRMSLLKSDDLFSGKKYIPQTYVDRIRAKKELDNKLFFDEETWDLLLVTGPPQHGKTSFVCNMIDTYHSNNIPSLFYPAISLKEGLLNALVDDFQWSFNSNFSIIQIAQRLNSILERRNQHLVIVIDGWNEMFDTPLRLNEECMRLNSKRIKIVISSTSASLERMLYDSAGNLEFVGSIVKLTKEQIRKLCSEPLQNTKKIGILQIGKFNSEEINEAKSKYGKAFNVQYEDGGNLPHDPFYLRLAAEQYTNGIIPAFANRSSLIHNSILSKGSRSRIEELELLRGLIALSEVLYKYDSPIKLVSMPQLFNSDNLGRWCEAAILQELKNEISTEVDFYYTHDRDYSIAILYKEWHNLFQESTSTSRIIQELHEAIKTEAGRTALQWFLSCPDYFEHLKVVFSILSKDLNKDLVRFTKQPILNQVKLNNKLDFEWLEIYLTEFIGIDQDQPLENSEISELIYAYVTSIDRVKNKSSFEFWITALLKYDTSLEDLGPEECYMAQIFECEIEGYTIYDTSNLDIELLERLVLHSDEEVASKSALYLAYTAPYGFLENLIEYRKKLLDSGRDYESILNCACDRIIYYLDDYYYGNFCKGVLIEAEIGDEDIEEEYFYLKSIAIPIINAYCNNGIGRFLFYLLNEIRIKMEINDDIDLENSNQLKFDF
ncbi:type I restriction enzyme HsdR N-terminal domain-containing protein [Chryseobacterium sp. WG14]|uniref:type I restriction enzyme HsdR N-terminal domain-containing protein n=1 Tax=Chryseobacterium sp. WG14 TaxID=2926909 RepID=UPI00211E48E1|nr:type I restriction enzyme HsdR N-terminal domain-containing protein [Chryseobacterium sp. WG14]MCQ9637914.1 type I restriction enzyme HsdR N-terminal domain-containing protein [Chryseobacterium sp. WG14]